MYMKQGVGLKWVLVDDLTVWLIKPGEETAIMITGLIGGLCLGDP